VLFSATTSKPKRFHAVTQRATGYTQDSLIRIEISNDSPFFTSFLVFLALQHNNSLDASGISGLAVDNLFVTWLLPAASTQPLCPFYPVGIVMPVPEPTSQSVATPQSDDVAVAALLLDEWKWRHQHCWKSLQRYSLAALTLALIPYVWLLREPDKLPPGSPDLFRARFGSLVLIFPFAALVLAQAAVWLFASEYMRCRPVEAMYNTVLGSYSPNAPTGSYANTPTAVVSHGWQRSVAQLTIVIVGVFSALLTLANVYVLVEVANLTIRWYYWLSLFGVVALFIVGDFVLATWTKAEVGRRIAAQSRRGHLTANGAQQIVGRERR
jgi:hypothetical protein